MKRGHQWGFAIRWLMLPVAVILILVIFAGALDDLNTDRAEEDQRQLEQVLRRGCMTCYAAEGIYPPNLDYLEEHYGIQIDRERYTVYYDIFGSNLMPEITVLENER